jgi:DNA invertase Pin-like site-specific DNA recombinase/chorismate mutase
MRVATYVRMSTNKQEHSPEQQRAALTQHATKHGYKIVADYSDLGVSGTSVKKRVGFQRMHADALAGKFDRILCFDRSRFGRLDSLESGRWLAPLRDAGVELETIAEGVSNWNDFGGRVVDAVLAESKHAFAVDLARATIRGLTAKAAEARGYTGGVTPFGYRRITRLEGRNRISTLEIAAVSAPIVQKMFALYAAPGGSLNGVARMLNETGVPCSNGGQRWRRNSVERVLKNRVYCGDLVWGRRSSGKFFTRHNGTEIVARKPYSKVTMTTAIEHQDVVPAIIDRDTFATVQRLMQERQKQTRSTASIHPLSGLVFCDCCGRAMHTDGRDRMRCPSSVADGTGSPCSSFRVPTLLLYDAVTAGLRDRLTPSALASLERALRAAARRQHHQPAADLRAGLEGRVRELEAEITAGAKRVLEVPKSLMGEVANALQAKVAERDRLAAELAAIKASGERPADAVGRLVAVLRDVRRALAGADPATVNAILRAAGVRVTTRPISTRRRASGQRPTGRASRLASRAKAPRRSARVELGDLYTPGSMSVQVARSGLASGVQVPGNAPALVFAVEF